MRNELLARWPLILGLAALLVPTFVSLAKQVWTTEAGVHGPIVLATGLWLLTQRKQEIRTFARSGSPVLTVLALIPSLIVYVFGRSFDFISLEVAGLIGVLVAIAHAFVGLEVLRRLWFPILYFCFMIPLPGALVDYITAPLKEWVSWSSTSLLEKAGYPIGREGVTIFVAQYQLLVEDACAGLNSLISLISISLFYIYILHNATWRYSLFLMLWIVPVAMLANMVRIIILVLITYYWGDAAAQGYLHSTAGLVMFATALIGIFIVDGAIGSISRLFARKSA